MPDAPGLELLAQELRDAYARRRPRTVVLPRQGRDRASTRRPIGDVLEPLRGKGFSFLASVHGVDYYPEEPRLGVHYELLDMKGRPPDASSSASRSTRRPSRR